MNVTEQTSNGILELGGQVADVDFVEDVPHSELVENIDDYIENIVCQDSEPNEGMKEYEFGSEYGKILLIKQNGVIKAVGNKCSHCGTTLVDAALINDRIRCPLYGTCYNIKTGDIEDFPGLDGIPSYQVEVLEAGGIKVRAKIKDLRNNTKVKDMSSRDPNNKKSFIVIGGGPSGQICVETLRQEGFTGRLVLVTADGYPPYDRSLLSKQLNLTIDTLQLRPEMFYKEFGIELMLSTEVVAIDPENKVLTLDNSGTLNYDSLFIATGSVPRILNLPRSDCKNVFTLRSLLDANKIDKVITPTTKVVIIGSSSIGMEVAAYCVKTCNEEPGSVTVICRTNVPFAESYGEVVGSRIAQMFLENGVKLHLNVAVDSLEGDSTKVTNIILSDNTNLPVDVVIFGIGSNFTTDFLKNSGINLNNNGSVPVNEFLETNCPGVFAGGDIAEAPVYAAGNIAQTIGHWGLAHYHGRIAALNMISLNTPVKAVPFFWTILFGTSFRYAGHATSYDDTVVGGDVENLKFACYYCSGDKVIAVSTVGTDPIAAYFAELLHNGIILEKKEIIENPLTWIQIKFHPLSHITLK